MEDDNDKEGIDYLKETPKTIKDIDDFIKKVQQQEYK